MFCNADSGLPGPEAEPCGPGSVRNMSRVLVVGAGLTGSVCACLLRRQMQNQVQIVVWDKARGTGGRMSTSRPPDPSSHSADLGAQYITATPAYAQSHSSFYGELLAGGLLQPLAGRMEGLQPRGGGRDYVAPQGSGSLVRHFLSQSGADLVLEQHVTALWRRGASWEVERRAGGSERFDAVVLTMPVPQILQLQGDLGECLSPQQRLKLEAVRFSSRFALALFFPPAADLCLPWVARYVSDSILRYVAVDNRKRGAEPPGVGPSLVVHTSVPFGLEHLERDKEEVQPIVLQELSRLLPDLPRPISIKCQKWRYSQVQTAVPDCPGHMTVSGRPPLLLAGDAFSHSNFDGCLESALSAVAALQPALDALRA